MSTDIPLDSSASWFDPVYEAADRRADAVPWANLHPCGWVTDYASANPGPGTAVIVGCGLGDDAEVIAAARYTTTAFDVSRHAVEWCRDRFPDSAVDYRVADLLDLDADLVGRFDLVVEVRTIQSLPPRLREQSIDGVASLVIPDGVVLIVALARPDSTVPNGPPWAVSPSELERFVERGLVVTRDRSESGHIVLELSRSTGLE